MKQFGFAVETCEQIHEHLNTDEIIHAAHSTKNILVQLYSEKSDIGEIKRFVDTIKSNFPQSIVVGATSAGEISDGHLILDSTMVSLSFFDSSELIPISQNLQPGNEYKMGKNIAETLARVPDIKGVLILASPILVNCAQLLNGINDHLQDIIVFGGGAAGINSQNAVVFLNDIFFDQGGVVAVGLAGENLFLETASLTGWKALGPQITLTDTDGFDILKINEKPAFDVYSKYLGLNLKDDLFLLEFPLLLERNGTTLARNPISSEKDGRVSMIADVYKGECARLGYLDVDGVMENVKSALNIMEKFKPEVIFIYSCICRRFALQQDVELEIFPFYKIAPVTGFFTYGEFYRIGDHLELLNSSEILVGIREGTPKPLSHVAEETIGDDVNHYSLRHITLTSRLFRFISTLTEQLEGANRLLKFQASHDQLTGAYNRHALNENLSFEISYSERHGYQLSFILFDIDHFKNINDQYGHLAGDQVLKNVSDVVYKSTRANDTLYRYGGEEFLLLLPNTPLEGAVVVAEKIRNNIESMTLTYYGLNLPKITASFGVACYPDQGENAENIISALDAAMYRSKNLGRNLISVASKKS